MPVLQRSIVAASLVLATGLIACGDKPTATAEGSASSSAAPAVIAPKRIDPLVMKTYRVESCYYGTLSLKQARASYLGSLGGAEPSADKVPDFGADTSDPMPVKGAPMVPSEAVEAAAPAGSGSSAPKASAPKEKAKAKDKAPAAAKTTGSAAPKVASAPKGSASPEAGSAPAASVAAAPSGSAAAGRPPFDLSRRIRQVPYERFARSCNVAAGLKEPVSAELDPVLKEYADYALPLAKTIAEANAYYQKEQFKEDGFAKGKEYHQKLVEGFGKLDDMQKKLRDALDKWRTASPVDTAGYTASQKLADGALTSARDALLKLDAGDLAGMKASLDKVDQAAAELKKYADEHKDEKDPWANFVPPTLTTYVEQLRAFDGDAAAIPPAKLVNAVTLFTRVTEANHRALTRKMAEGAGRAIGTQRMIKPKLPAGHPQ
jgi:hypothetical protein